ncbi:hypothetical protein AVEN_89330-1 [Araneus ventricosus]|uniref:Uncharacterized protein n=1 Tax=Araneus ventricosus TaxID=182803 RepID=A0A4Y2VCP1_ARAVE|nr:hypothetical protein AVEN_89330-1 [Araneus ventricosus]
MADMCKPSLTLVHFPNKPTSELKMLVNYIMKTYAAVWFEIKRYPSVKCGPTHIFIVVQSTRHLPDNIKKNNPSCDGEKRVSLSPREHVVGYSGR